MTLRSQNSVWWPKFSEDVQSVRDACAVCRRNAPSQPQLPSVPPPNPDYPMQLIATDYFNYAGKNYLVIVDRYSGWPVVRLCKDETAKELVRALREFFCRYGVPEQLGPDSGSVYTLSTTQGFLKTWWSSIGLVHHTIPKAIYMQRQL